VPRFQPLFKPTLWFLPAFLLLIALGVWQVHRLHWKLGLIAEVNHHLTATPISLARVLALPPDQAQYRRVTLTGHFLNGKESYAFATGSEGMPGYHVMTPFVAAGGAVVMVDRGFVPKEFRNPQTRKASLLEGLHRITGIWRTPSPANLFTPAPDLRQRIWYARDIVAMAAAVHVRLVAPMVLEADATPNPGGWPKGGQTVVDFPNNHLQYAITWFALAAGLLVIYLLYHRGQGRLRFS